MLPFRGCASLIAENRVLLSARCALPNGEQLTGAVTAVAKHRNGPDTGPVPGSYSWTLLLDPLPGRPWTEGVPTQGALLSSAAGGTGLTLKRRHLKNSSYGDVAERLKAAVC
jgi:hypothetical protein